MAQHDYAREIASGKYDALLEAIRPTIEAVQAMTTDPEEGRRQIEAMKPEPLKVGDKVRLKAGEQSMTVVALEDYGNQVVCEWPVFSEGESAWDERDTFPAASLVRVE